MEKKRLGLYYLLAWVLYALYIYLDLFFNKRGSQPYVWSNMLASFAGFSFAFFIVYPRLLRRKLFPLFLLGLVLAEGVFIGVRALVEEVLYVWLLGHHNYFPDTTVAFYIGDNWWKAFQPVLLSFIIWAFLEIYTREKETERLRQEKTLSELAFLRSQINPHFLYNTLNYLYSQAYPLSEKLGGAILKLSGLMRYMLAESPDGKLELEKEVDYLRNYIELYRLRFEDRCFVEFDCEGVITGRRIAALALIPWVENAFKHGVVDDPRRPLKIRLQVSPQRLSFVVSNKINRNQKDPSGGIGMANIRRRLELLYPGKHELIISNNGETYKTSLVLNLGI